MEHPKVTQDQIEKDLKTLTIEERNIYDSVMLHFPATHHLSALDAAWQGGIKFQFIQK